MVSVRGYFKNNRFVPAGKFLIPEGKQVIVTILDDEPSVDVSEAEKQRQIFADFFDALKADEEKLSPAFDEAISEGLKFRELDWS